MSDEKDISGRVLITPVARHMWSLVAEKAVKALYQGLPLSIGTEVVYLNPDNATLTVSCAVGEWRIAMIIPADHWSWDKSSDN